MTTVLKFIENGDWHKLPELAQKTGYTTKKLAKYCETLAKHDLVEYDPKTNSVRLSQELINLITQLHAKEAIEARWERRGVATIIIPPEKSFKIQKVTIHNLANQDLQFELKFNTELHEIAITQV